jgi:phage shock protein PspC (stress-responsive transcriptional regulator)
MKQIKRNEFDGQVVGVCQGIGEYYNIDPFWLRLIFVCGTIFTIVPFILIYIILWIIIPEN